MYFLKKKAMLTAFETQPYGPSPLRTGDRLTTCEFSQTHTEAHTDARGVECKSEDAYITDHFR